MTLPTPPKGAPRRLRVLAAGDSLTAGGPSGGYRGILHRLLVAAGYAPDWQGSEVTHATIDGQPLALFHEGHIGATIAGVSDALGRAGVLDPAPDVLLLLAGSNDVFGGIALEGAPSRLLRLVDALSKRLPAPHTRMLVGLLPPLDGRASEVAAFNASAGPALWTRRHQGVRVVPTHHAYAVAQTEDGVHPTTDGNRALATAWMRAIDVTAPSVPAALAGIGGGLVGLGLVLAGAS